MDVSQKILSDITIYSKYARHINLLNRRETWEEICNRNMEMHIKKFPLLYKEIEEVYNNFVIPKKILPSMRSLQFAGKPILVNPTRQYNCSALAITCPEAFAEVMFLLLGGTGVGYSVQKNHVKQLPKIQGIINPVGKQRKQRYLVGDSIEGWADAIKVLVSSYFYGKKAIDFDLRDIRPKGSRLVTAGGKAPGPEPLRKCLTQITSIFENAIQERGRGTQLKPIECHDICCFIADAVLAGGIRRSACISLFSKDDLDMLYCKSGFWWEKNPQRARSNNSAVFLKAATRKKDFMEFWEIVKNSGSGEPGIFFTNDPNILTNPCAEIALKDMGFCNLTEINASNIESQEDLNARARAAAILGTLQASYTDFHYLRDEWRDNAESESLLGVSMTGVASNSIVGLNLEEAANEVVATNKYWADLLGIKPAKRNTTGKPSGTTSCVLGCSSGVHSWHAKFFLRRMRINKDEALYKYLAKYHPELLEDDVTAPHTTAIIALPQKAPDGAITRDDETAIDLLERVKHIHENWIMTGHIDGANSHNQSVTISVKDHEWDEVGEWMWKNRNVYHGISVLPFDGGTYQQAPFEEITEEEYNRLYNTLKDVDLTKIIEYSDTTDLQGEAACVGGACAIV